MGIWFDGRLPLASRASPTLDEAGWANDRRVDITVAR